MEKNLEDCKGEGAMLFINFYFLSQVKSASDLRIKELLGRFLIENKVIWLSKKIIPKQKIFFEDHENLFLLERSTLKKTFLVESIIKLFYWFFGNKKYHFQIMIDEIINTLNNSQLKSPNIIFLNYFAHKRLIKFLKNTFPDSKIIIDTNDVQYQRYSALYRKASLVKYFLKKFSLYRFKLDEIKALRLADLLISVSESDSNFFKRIGSKKVLFVRQGFPRVHRPNIMPSNKKLLFVGVMASEANIRSVKYFVTKIFPIINDKIPDAVFYIVGSNPTREIKNMAGKNIVVTGYVENITEFYLASRVLVCPFDYTYGQRTRIYEAITHGIPCVVNTNTIKGMSLDSEAGVIIKDDPTEFAYEVIKILTDFNYWKTLSGHAVSFSENNLIMESTFDKILKEI